MLAFVALALALPRFESPPSDRRAATERQRASEHQVAPAREAAPDPRPPVAGPSRPFRLQAELGGRANPPGVKLRLTLSYRHGLGEPLHASWPRPYVEGGVGASANPGSAATSIHVEWMQLAFLVLRVQGDLYRCFGVNGTLLEFPDSAAPFGRSAIDAAAGQELSRFGARVLLQPTLRAKVGWAVVQNQSDFAWYRFGSGGPYFLQREYDTLLKDGDGLFANRSVVLAELWSRGSDVGLLTGPFYEVQRTFAAGLQRQRVGGVVRLCPTERLGLVARPRLVLQVGVNLEDPNREGQLFVGGALHADFDL